MPDAPKKSDDAQVPQAPELERVFLADDLIPNAAEAFRNPVLPLEDAIKIADVVLDTNVLLLPYGAGSSSFTEIIKILRQLRDQNRLFLPAQAAREFIRNRPNKLGELQQQLGDKISRYLSIEKLNFPVLEGTAEYTKLNEVLEKTAAVKKELSEASKSVVQMIKSWEWNDPVNLAYSEVLRAEAIIEPNINRETTLAELKRRHLHSIPPGYKDAKKDDLGIGDFLIWLTILEIGGKNKKPLVFVSGDEKADWQHRSGGQGFLPRYELLDEYRRKSDGKPFYIIPLSKLLELLNVEIASVNEIKQEEVRIQEANSIIVDCPYCGNEVPGKLSEQIGSTTHPLCANCEHRFHVHRTRDGVIVRADALPSSGINIARSLSREIFHCPNCQSQIEADLGQENNATSWCRCDSCEARFPIHRRANGDIFISWSDSQQKPTV